MFDTANDPMAEHTFLNWTISLVSSPAGKHYVFLVFSAGTAGMHCGTYCRNALALLGSSDYVIIASGGKCSLYHTICPTGFGTYIMAFITP